MAGLYSPNGSGPFHSLACRQVEWHLLVSVGLPWSSGRRLPWSCPGPDAGDEAHRAAGFCMLPHGCGGFDDWRASAFSVRSTSLCHGAGLVSRGLLSAGRASDSAGPRVPEEADRRWYTLPLTGAHITASTILSWS